MTYKMYVYFVNGTTNNDILLGYFAESMYYVSPGAVGLGVLHSFSYGVPVITMIDTEHGPELNNIINTENGFVSSNCEEFSESISNVISDKTSKILGRNAFAYYMEKRQLNNMISGFINALNSL